MRFSVSEGYGAAPGWRQRTSELAPHARVRRGSLPTPNARLADDPGHPYLTERHGIYLGAETRNVELGRSSP